MSRDATAFLREVGLFAGLDEATRHRVATAATSTHVPAREWLFEQGDPGDTWYAVRTGRLHVVRDGEVVGVLTRGDAFGELALLQGGIRAAGVRAVRDAELLALRRTDFAALLGDQRFAAGLLAALATNLRRTTPDPPAVPRVVTVVGHGSLGDPRPLAADLARAIGPDRDVGVVGPGHLPPDAEGDPAAAAALVDRAEHTHDLVLLLVGADVDPHWRAFATRQADRVLLLSGCGDAVPAADATAPTGGVDLVLVGATPPAANRMRGWWQRVQPRTVHRLAPASRAADLARLGRRLTGRAVGLVCSGGGARGLAHLGVLHALAEAGITVDRFGGTSIGSLVTGLAALGLPADRVEEICRDELVARRPFADWTVPRHALLRGRRGAAMLRRVFGGTVAELLPRPWFALACDLTAAEPLVLRTGPVHEAVAASISLPGIAPPRWLDGRLLVDGGVVNNLPVDVMLADGEGPVIAVDVMRSWHGAFDADRRQVPPLVATLAAASGIAGRAGAERTRQLADVLVTPEIDTVGLLDWHRVDDAVAAGHRAAAKALDSWTPPS